MAKYLTRVELHGAQHGDHAYDVLHTAMGVKGFSRMIVGDQGNVYRLPTAEYQIETGLTTRQVNDTALAAANSTRLKSSVITVQYVEAAWTPDMLIS